MKRDAFIHNVKDMAEKEPIPDSLSPDNIKNMLSERQAKKPEHPWARRRRPLVVGLSAACAFLVLGVYAWQYADLGDSSNQADQALVSEEATNHATDELATEEDEAEDEATEASDESGGAAGEDATEEGATGEESAEESGESEPSPNDLTPTSYEQIKQILLDNEQEVRMESFSMRNAVIPEESVDVEIQKNSAASSDSEAVADSEFAAEAESAPAALDDSASGDAGSSPTEEGYSKTNTQVEGVDEADILKTDGKYLYAVKTSTGLDVSVAIIEATKGKMKKVSTIDVAPPSNSSSLTMHEMYLDGDHLTILCSFTESLASDDDSSKKKRDNVEDYWIPSYTNVTLILNYDVSDKANPRFINSLTQDGRYTSSRKSGNFLYTFSIHDVYGVDEDAPAKNLIPRAQEGEPIPYKDILLPEYATYNSFLVVTALDVTQPEEFTSQRSILATSNCFYVSANNIYATSPITRDLGGKKKNGYVTQTQIIRIPYSDGQLRKATSVVVDGTINNSFSLDEYDGHLRMVTHVEEIGDVQVRPLEEPMIESQPDVEIEESIATIPMDSVSYNALFILDSDLNVTGEIRDLAPGETIYSARFFGDTGYFVTFRNVDPLFSVDLGNPDKPKVLGKLKIPGFSNYLHFYSDTLLLGIGMDVKKDGTPTNRIKLSMFDTSDPSDVREVDKMVLDDYQYSDALYNHKAIMIDTDKNLFGFLATTWSYQEDWGRFLTFSYRDGFVQNAAYKLMDATNAVIPSYEGRGTYIGDYIYIYQRDTGIQSYSLEAKGGKPVDSLSLLQ